MQGCAATRRDARSVAGDDQQSIDPQQSAEVAGAIPRNWSRDQSTSGRMDAHGNVLGSRRGRERPIVIETTRVFDR